MLQGTEGIGVLLLTHTAYTVAERRRRNDNDMSLRDLINVTFDLLAKR